MQPIEHFNLKSQSLPIDGASATYFDIKNIAAGPVLGFFPCQTSLALHEWLPHFPLQSLGKFVVCVASAQFAQAGLKPSSPGPMPILRREPVSVV
jgi:hypothetical protein